MKNSIDPSVLFNNRILDLTLLPIEQCNFRCTYCYEKFVDGEMKPDLVESIKSLLEKRSPELDFLRIGWFGGEPLLTHKLVVEISTFAQRLSERNPCMTFVSGMSTNGYLLDVEMMERLTSAGVTAFQVSIDGTAEQHDRLRVKRNGEGTFERIWTNLLALKASSLDFVINIRVHYSKDNIDNVITFTDDLRENFADDPRFNIFFKTIEKLGGKNDDTLNVYDSAQAEDIKNILMQRLGGTIRDAMPSNSCYVCYAGKPNAFVIRHDGRIVKCTVGLDDPENLVGQMRPGGRMEIINETLRPWLEGAVNLDADFLRCPRAKLSAFPTLEVA